MLQIEFNESGPSTTLTFFAQIGVERRDIGVVPLPRHAAEALLTELLTLGATVIRVSELSRKPILDGDARVKSKGQG